MISPQLVPQIYEYPEIAKGFQLLGSARARVVASLVSQNLWRWRTHSFCCPAHVLSGLIKNVSITSFGVYSVTVEKRASGH